MDGPGSWEQRSGIRHALAEVRALPGAERERALAAVVVAHDAELARAARRAVRTIGATAGARYAALEIVETSQRALMQDVATGRRHVDDRAWPATMRFESARAARQGVARGVLAATPYRQRLAADRAVLVQLRRAAGPSGTTTKVDEVAARWGAVAPAEPAAVAPLAQPRAHRPSRRPASRPRHPRRAVGPARWGVAAVLTSVTLLVGANVATAVRGTDDAAEIALERPTGSTSDLADRFPELADVPFSDGPFVRPFTESVVRFEHEGRAGTGPAEDRETSQDADPTDGATASVASPSATDRTEKSSAGSTTDRGSSKTTRQDPSATRPYRPWDSRRGSSETQHGPGGRASKEPKGEKRPAHTGRHDRGADDDRSKKKFTDRPRGHERADERGHERADGRGHERADERGHERGRQTSSEERNRHDGARAGSGSNGRDRGTDSQERARGKSDDRGSTSGRGGSGRGGSGHGRR
ncbi:hypothetical protein [Isoptericola rhizosphaerae]|uniref:hypothetical protein n=1 Tax=Isoptericola rhizosphaerae TaxID=3377837 RepID=UPI00383AE47A